MKKRTDGTAPDQIALADALFETDHVLIAQMDRNFDLIRVNSAFARSGNRKHSFYKGKNYFALFPCEDIQRIFEEVRESGEPYSAVEKPLGRAEDDAWDMTYWNWSFVPVKGRGEKVQGFVLSQVNVTRTKWVEQELLKEHDFRTAIEDSVSAGIIVFDLDGSLAYSNRAFCEMTGWPQEELLGALVPLPFWVQHSETAVMAAVHDSLSRGEERDPVECLFQRKDGETFWVLASFRFIRDTRNQRPVGWVETIIDITNRKEAEESLRAAETLVRRNERMATLGLLVSEISHEINNPNNFISFNLPILRDYVQALHSVISARPHCPAEREFFGMSYADFYKDLLKMLQNIENGSKRIERTVSVLRDFARERKGGERLFVDLRTGIQRAVSLCQRELSRKGLETVDVHVADRVPPASTCPEELELILVNLVINAAHALDKEEGRISVLVAQDDPLVVEVEDNGCGMDRQTREKVLLPFFTTKPAGSGTGLGLYITRNLVTRLGGKLEIESVAGQGTTCRVTLPAPAEGTALPPRIQSRPGEGQ